MYLILEVYWRFLFNVFFILICDEVRIFARKKRASDQPATSDTQRQLETRSSNPSRNPPREGRLEEEPITWGKGRGGSGGGRGDSRQLSKHSWLLLALEPCCDTEHYMNIYTSTCTSYIEFNSVAVNNVINALLKAFNSKFSQGARLWKSQKAFEVLKNFLVPLRYI